MRGFGVGLVAGASAVLAVWLLALYGQLGREYPGNAWVERAYEHKLAAAARVPRPKLLVVAGSGAMFGIESGLLEAAFDRPVVNLGVNAGVLSPFIVDYALRALRPGDWVVLPLEYPLYHDEGFVNQQFIDFYLSHPLPVADTGWLRLLKTLWSAPLRRVVEGYEGLPDGFAVRGTYGPHNLGPRGDQIRSERAQRTIAMQQAVVASPPERYGARAAAVPASWSRWRAFAERVRREGGCAIFVPPAMLSRPEYAGDSDERAYYNGLPARARAEGLVFAGEPFAFMYDEDAFFDTNFHLTAEMREIHTKRLIAVLAPTVVSHCR